MSDTDWTTIETFENEALAELAREKLGQAGIPAVTEPGDASAYMGASTPTGVAVPPEHVDRAKELLGD